jgi:hypothetical protein
VNLLCVLQKYRSSRDRLEMEKARIYYHGRAVRVDCDRYRGMGMSVTDNLCPPDQVAVSLPNGNTWRYALEDVMPV